MPVTIQLNDDLADQLQRRAAVRQLSLEEFTIRLLHLAKSRQRRHGKIKIVVARR
jgi:hypothetical protein